MLWSMRRRGGKTTTHSFAFDLKPDAGGELLKQRVDCAIPRASLEARVTNLFGTARGGSAHCVVP
jgi:hypothetical protein